MELLLASLGIFGTLAAGIVTTLLSQKDSRQRWNRERAATLEDRSEASRLTWIDRRHDAYIALFKSATDFIRIAEHNSQRIRLGVESEDASSLALQVDSEFFALQRCMLNVLMLSPPDDLRRYVGLDVRDPVNLFSIAGDISNAIWEEFAAEGPDQTQKADSGVSKGLARFTIAIMACARIAEVSLADQRPSDGP